MWHDEEPVLPARSSLNKKTTRVGELIGHSTYCLDGVEIMANLTCRRKCCRECLIFLSRWDMSAFPPTGSLAPSGYEQPRPLQAVCTIITRCRSRSEELPPGS